MWLPLNRIPRLTSLFSCGAVLGIGSEVVHTEFVGCEVITYPLVALANHMWGQLILVASDNTAPYEAKITGFATGRHSCPNFGKLTDVVARNICAHIIEGQVAQHLLQLRVTDVLSEKVADLAYYRSQIGFHTLVTGEKNVWLVA